MTNLAAIDLINEVIAIHGNTPYDKVKAHEYYLRTRQLKGRKKAAPVAPKGRPVMAKMVSASEHQKIHKQTVARLARLTTKLHSLQNALKEAEQALQNKRQQAQKNSDGKTTAKERQAAKQYRDTHKAQIKATEKKASSSGGSSAPKSVSQMSESELTTRVTHIKHLIASAQKQIKATNDTLRS